VTEARTKQFRAVGKASGVPEAAQLAAIRRYTLDDIPAEQLVVREYALAHNAIDRDNECFDEPFLAQLAATLQGKGVYITHPTGWSSDGGPAEGRVFETRVERMTLEAARTLLREPQLTLPPDRTDAEVMFATAYYVRTDENGAFLAKHAAGIVGDVSVGFTAKNPPVRVLDAAGIELNVWRWKAPGEALEMSLVWLGAQPGARAVKSARNEANDMDPNDKTPTADQQRIKTLEGEVTKAATTVAKHDALKAALGDANAVLLDNPAELVALVTAGKAHRDGLVDALIANDRTKGALGDDEAAVSAARTEYAAMPIGALQRLAKHATPAAAPAAPATASGDPNGTTAPGGTKGAADGVFANPLIAS
jgi:hypothetical protein